MLSRALILLLCIFAFTGKANAILLETLYASNNGGNFGGAVYFDLSVGAQGINITSLFANSAETPGATSGFDVYTKLGSAAGSETTVGDWALATSG